jgi:hypothetical protein
MLFTQSLVEETNYLDAVKLLAKYDVIFTGSYVLKLNHLLPEREVHDIDLVFKSEEDVIQFIVNTSGKFIPLNTDSESEDDRLFNIEIPDINGIKIDCFINPEVQYVSLFTEDKSTVINTQMPRYILQQKLNILFDRRIMKDDTYKKHLNDFNYIFGGK